MNIQNVPHRPPQLVICR